MSTYVWEVSSSKQVPSSPDFRKVITRFDNNGIDDGQIKLEITITDGKEKQIGQYLSKGTVSRPTGSERGIDVFFKCNGVGLVKAQWLDEFHRWFDRYLYNEYQPHLNLS